MVMLSARWTGPVTSKNWKIALQLKLRKMRNFCMRPARRIIDTGRASYVWAECATALIMVEFSEGKFILRRELFLTKSSVNRVEKSIPVRDRGVFRMFISSTASCTYNKVCFSVTFIIMKLPMLVADIRISGARSRMDMLPDYFEAAATSKICLSGTRGSA